MQTEHDYISRNEIYEFLDHMESVANVHYDEIIKGVILGTVDAIRKLVGLAKKQDVVPVRHGKWETAFLAHEYLGCRPYAHYCSVCHQIIAFWTFYCPNCGARMDGDGDV